MRLAVGSRPLSSRQEQETLNDGSEMASCYTRGLSRLQRCCLSLILKVFHDKHCAACACYPSLDLAKFAVISNSDDVFEQLVRATLKWWICTVMYKICPQISLHYLEAVTIIPKLYFQSFLASMLGL